MFGVLPHDRLVFRYLMDFGGGERDVVSLLEPDWVYQHGLHPEAVLAVVGGGADRGELTPADVRESGPFLRLLSRVIFENVTNNGDICREADVQGSGYVYLLDARTPDPAGRVSSEDIIGAVQVNAGKPVSGSYQHNPKHRLFTVNGWFRLPDDLETALQHRLRAQGAA
ncbi:hypothetical protein ACN27G_10755 [Plantactinospora sp. WMMB334]|uniref:hypothetical protein n=1 Tax=Plantactinospora sp. WMMB334 TaxID=3404119 RepID=UPI003B942362